MDLTTILQNTTHLERRQTAIGGLWSSPAFPALTWTDLQVQGAIVRKEVQITATENGGATRVILR
jgi:hypothetical protein